MTLRPDGRLPTQLRPVRFTPNFTKWAEGSVLTCFGDTHVLVNATLEERVPGWMKDRGEGWVTAEYAMLPRATDKRTQRESVAGKVGGRTQEISRLVGRSLRVAVDKKKLGERTLTLDCDVLQADGGTRTAAITGAYVALALALEKLRARGALAVSPIVTPIAAVSLGVLDGIVLLDLAYAEDQRADTDLNLVMTGEGGIVEIQGTAEKTPFTASQLEQMLAIGRRGIAELVEAQRRCLAEVAS
jgi:ribonuclease PH